MAQTDPSIVEQLRKAILNIFQYPRGCRNYSDMMERDFIRKITVKEGKKFYKIFGDVLDQHVFYSANNYFDSEAPFQLENIIVSGSHSEGTQTMNLKTEQMSDIDYMLILKNIKVTEEDQKQGNLTFRETTAFVNLYVTDGHLIETWNEFLESSNESLCKKNTMLSSMKLKERFKKKYTDYGPMFAPLNSEDIKEVDDGPSIAVTSSLPGGNELPRPQLLTFPVGEFDFVLAIECEGWPLCAHEWPSRLRRWPTQDIIHNIIRGGFHIVCKSCSEGKFRLSFSNAETLLIQNLSELQFKTYRAFKSFIAHYKNEWSSNIKKIFCSYNLKTIVLWYCEKCDPKDWNEDTVVRHLLSLIDELVMALKKRSLPMYFMPKYNLMEKMEDGADVAAKIGDLRFNLQLISDAIISEEPTNIDWANFFCRHNFSEHLLQFLKEGIETREFEPNKFFECLSKLTREFDKFWISAVGRVPTRNDEQGRKGLNTFLGPFIKYWNAALKYSDYLCIANLTKYDEEESSNSVSTMVKGNNEVLCVQSEIDNRTYALYSTFNGCTCARRVFFNFQRVTIICTVLTTLLNIEDIEIIVDLPK